MIHYPALKNNFYDRHAIDVSKDLLGKVICVKYTDIWLTTKIIETEAYLLEDKASHASLGYTEKRKALFMPPGTIYMYYARGADSLNISVQGQGAAVLIKSGIPYVDQKSHQNMLELMYQLNPNMDGSKRAFQKLCSGQTLLCRALNLKVKDWDQQAFNTDEFYIADVNYTPKVIIQTTRMGIPKGRDEHLPYRFIDQQYVQYCTSNPLTKRLKNFQLIDCSL